ncbi:hypothetical protein L567_1587 [Bordetella pertussis STO1-CHLA-0006]|nr:hypothetical protein L567_1587 [Bordetella pertussis STO1-CHLA-0006]
MYRLAVFFLPPGRPKAKKPPWGAASPHSGRSVGAFFCRRAAPRQKSPLGGQQARTAGAAWGPFACSRNVLPALRAGTRNGRMSRCPATSRPRCCPGRRCRFTARPRRAIPACSTCPIDVIQSQSRQPLPGL